MVPKITFWDNYTIVLKHISARKLKKTLKQLSKMLYLFEKEKGRSAFLLEDFALIRARAGPIWARNIKKILKNNFSKVV